MKIIKYLLISFLSLFFFGCTSVTKEKSLLPDNQKDTEKTFETVINEEYFLCTDKNVTTLPETSFLVLDDFEDGNYWYGVGNSWDQWGSHNLSLNAEVVSEWASSGNHSLKATMDCAGSDTSKQATWCCNSLIENNLSGFKWVEVSVYNPQEFDFELNIAVQDGIKYEWMQTETLYVKPGKTTCLFNISSMPDSFLENVFCFMIQSLNENPGGYLFFDNFKLYE